LAQWGPGEKRRKKKKKKKKKKEKFPYRFNSLLHKLCHLGLEFFRNVVLR
jgi:hypothetical protein